MIKFKKFIFTKFKMRLGDFLISFNKKEKAKEKEVLVVYADKEKARKLKIPSKLIEKDSFEKNKVFSFGPFKGYKKVVVLPFSKKKLNPFVLSKLTVKISENTTVDLRALPKEYQDLAIEFILSKSYKFEKYKSKEEDKKEILVNFLTTKRDFKEILNKMEALYFARDLVNEPSNVLTPKEFVERAKEKLKDLPVEVEILNKEQLKKENFNLMLAVAKGSDNEPYLLIIKYLPKENEKPIALVGKGVCFDTGGYDIKPWPHMNTMKMDMSGAAVVLGTIYALAKNNVQKNVVAIIPLVENAISGRAYKPDDIIKSRSGKFVEIISTDAEGRLILADSIDYSKQFNPKEIITVATLTGAALVALGEDVAALMADDDKKAQKLTELSLKIEERVYPLPLWPEVYKEYIENDISDLRNLSKYAKEAGTITAGLFLKEFADDYSFIHLDIAGPAIKTRETRHLPKGGTAFGLRLLYSYIKQSR